MAPLPQLIAILAIAAIPVHACNFHARRHSDRFSNPHTGTVYKRAEEEIDFEYVNSFDWHTIKEGQQPIPFFTTTVGPLIQANISLEYKMCHSGTAQSPINIFTSQGLATTHVPDFSGYAAHGASIGTFNNWGFGPAYTLDPGENDDFSTLPALKFDNQTVFLSGWHIHFPSEHLVDGVRSRAELHMVHVDAAGEAAAVVGVRIEPSSITSSPFFDQLPTPLIHFNDTEAETEGVSLDHTLMIQEVGNVLQYWTYQGSLTTPPCSEGLRWFLPRQTLKVSEAQMVAMLESSRFSHRVEQVVWNQNINV